MRPDQETHVDSGAGDRWQTNFAGNRIVCGGTTARSLTGPFTNREVTLRAT